MSRSQKGWWWQWWGTDHVILDPRNQYDTWDPWKGREACVNSPMLSPESMSPVGTLLTPLISLWAPKAVCFFLATFTGISLLPLSLFAPVKFRTDQTFNIYHFLKSTALFQKDHIQLCFLGRSERNFWILQKSLETLSISLSDLTCLITPRVFSECFLNIYTFLYLYYYHYGWKWLHVLSDTYNYLLTVVFISTCAHTNPPFAARMILYYKNKSMIKSLSNLKKLLVMFPTTRMKSQLF